MDEELKIKINTLLSENLFSKTKSPRFKITPIDVNLLSKTYHCSFYNSDYEDIFIKTKSDSENDDRTKQEFEVLSSLWSKYAKEDKNIIAKPILYDAPSNHLLTSFIKGDSFSKSLSIELRYPFSFFYKRSLQKRILRISSWLLDFESKSFENEFVSFQHKIDFYLRKVTEISFLNISDIQKIQDRLYFVSKDISNFPCYLSNIDFNPTNTILSDDYVAVIDWEKVHIKGLAFWMLSAFIRYLDTLSYRQSISTSVAKKLVSSFEKNYFKKTYFREYIHAYPIIQSLEYIVAISESRNSIENKEPNKKNKHMLQKLNYILNSI